MRFGKSSLLLASGGLTFSPSSSIGIRSFPAKSFAFVSAVSKQCSLSNYHTLENYTTRPSRSVSSVSWSEMTSRPSRASHGKEMSVHIVPILQDNYSYLVVDEATQKAMVVDPAEPEKVLRAADALGVDITTVLTTHQHWDHAGGNEEFVRLKGPVQVVGSRVDDIPARTKAVEDNNVFDFTDNIEVTVRLTPCHTRGHVLYLVRNKKSASVSPALFSGDTLFVAGCGRFFAGTPDEMHYALNTVCASFPDDTKVYCGHEYTTSNLQFASSVEPSNMKIKEKLDWAVSKRKEGDFTVPSTIEEEKQTNPFMRVREIEICRILQIDPPDAVAVMGALRARKDSFKPPKL